MDEEVVLTRQHLYLNSGIPGRYKESSFENYITKGGDDLKTCEDIRDGKLSDAILCGGVGTGKTHLACAKINYVLSKGHQAVYIEMIKLIREIKDSWRDSSVTETSIIRKYGAEIPFLVIDEIGVSFGSDTEKQYLTEIINDRYNNHLKTYLITNLDMDSFVSVVGDRVVDRFMEANRLYLFNWPSFRGKK